MDIRSTATIAVPTKPVGIPLSEINDPAVLRGMVERLWSLMDDIDTSSDIFKSDNVSYRRYVTNKQQLRFDVLRSDGYNLLLTEATAQ